MTWTSERGQLHYGFSICTPLNSGRTDSMTHIFCSIFKHNMSNATQYKRNKKKSKTKLFISLLLVIPNNERTTIVHQQVNHKNGECTKTAVCIQACGAQTKFISFFYCLMTTTTQYPRKKENNLGGGGGVMRDT